MTTQLEQQEIAAANGAAASIIVVLIWVYYTSQIILMGAEITHAFAAHKGSIKQRGSIKEREQTTQDRAGQTPLHPAP